MASQSFLAQQTTSYKIEKGDTFSSIAKHFGVDVHAIQSANPGVDLNKLQIGLSIHVPASHSTTTYKIQQGDTFSSIAKHFGTDVQSIQSANPGVTAETLQIGQTIHVSSGHSNTASNGNTNTNTHGPSHPSGGVPGATGGGRGGGPYVKYTGSASNFPDPSEWASYDALWESNSKLMKYHDSEAEIGYVKSAIEQVARESGVDVRVILAIIMQESGGNVRVGTTTAQDGSNLANPGYMQSHAGSSFNASNPEGSILQMTRDGTTGTKTGDGLKQCFEKQGNWYAAVRMYNSGSVDKNDLGNAFSSVGSYSRDVANRLMGHVWEGM